MGKSDLIDKINARVRSQMSSLTARTSPRAATGEREARGAGRAEKRITNARTGKVVVRRRAQRPPPTETEPGATDAPATAAGHEETVPGTVGTAPVVRRQPQGAIVEEVQPGAPEAVADSTAGEALPGHEQEAQPSATAGPADEAASQVVAPESLEEAPRDAGAQVPDDAETSAGEQPAAEGTAEPSSSPAPVETAAEAPEPSSDDATPQQEADSGAAEAGEMASSAPAGTTTESAGQQSGARGAARTPASIEDVLERELGPLVQQRKAVIIGDAPVQQPSAGRTVGSRSVSRRPKTATVIKRATPQTPEEIKRVANEDRKREKGVVKLVSRGRVGKPEDRTIGRAARPRKGSRRKEVIQRRDIGANGEHTYRRQRRVVARRERASTQLTTPKAIKRIIKIEEAISVGELAHRMGVKAAAVIKKLMGLGMMANISQ